jgi:hypothetical protein
MSMRPLLSAAVSAVLWSTAAVAAEPGAPDRAKPAEAKAAVDAPAIPAGWSLMNSAEDGFRAAFPSAPQVDNRTVDTENGTMRVKIYGVYRSEGGANSLAVMVAYYPYGTTDPALAEEVMRGSRDALLNEQNYKLVSEKQVRVAGPKGDKSTFPGRDYEAIGPQGQHLSLRLILVNNRMYQLMFLRKAETNEPFKQLVSSFSLR